MYEQMFVWKCNSSFFIIVVVEFLDALLRGGNFILGQDSLMHQQSLES